MKYRSLIIFLFIFGNLPYSSGQEFQIAGFIYDRQTGKSVAGCNVAFSGQKKKQTITDERGFFCFYPNMELLKTNLVLHISHINYVSRKVEVTGKDTLQIYLDFHNNELKEVTVYSAYKGTNKGNEYTYTPIEASSTISIVGEPDVIRHISAMPGVSQGMEGTLGLFVRGGNNGSNSIVFNNVPIYSITHLGMFSTFSPDVISESSFYLGGMPAEQGNFSSSLITVDTRKHYGEPLQGKISVSPYLTGGYLSLPLKKEKMSVQVSGRTSLLPFFLNLFVKPNGNDSEKLKAQLLDFTTLADWKMNEKNNLNLMFYTANDYFDYRIENSQNKLNWGSRAFKLGWDCRLSPKLNANTVIYYTNSFSRQEQRSFKNSEPNQLQSILRLGSEIYEFSAGINFVYRTSDKLKFKLGIQYQPKEYQPLSEKSMLKEDSTTNSGNKFGKQTGHLSASYAEVNYALSGIIAASLGFRNSIWTIHGKNNWDFDIHALANIYLTGQWGVELTYDRLVQYFHVLEGLPVGWSHNVVMPADERFPNEITDQFFSGIYWKHQSKLTVHATVGGFYRKMKNLAGYINSSNIFGFNNVSWHDEADRGTGVSFGMEISASLQGKRTGATLAYTLSKSDRLFSKINEGIKFPFKFDRRHILNVQAKYAVSKRVTKKGQKREQYVNGVVSYSTGNRATLPTGNYQGITPPFWNQREPGWKIPFEMDDKAYSRKIMSGKNEFKMIDYFRVDLAYTFVRYGEKINNEFAVSVFNVLNRKNPYLYYHDDQKWYQLSIFPIMPALRWSISF